jgi:hypothetical protein
MHMFDKRGRPAGPGDGADREDERESPNAAVPGFADALGATPERIGRFFAAAADFFRSAPWRRIGDNVPIEVRFPADGGESRYGIVSGEDNEEFGLTFFHTLADLARAYSSDVAAPAEQEGMTFGSADDCAPGDLAGTRQHGWEVAGPDAYPAPVIVDRRGELRPPTLAELDRFEAAFRAIPTFVEKHMLSETGELRMAEAILSVPVGTGGRVGETSVYLRFPPSRKSAPNRGGPTAGRGRPVQPPRGSPRGPGRGGR